MQFRTEPDTIQPRSEDKGQPERAAACAQKGLRRAKVRPFEEASFYAAFIAQERAILLLNACLPSGRAKGRTIDDDKMKTKAQKTEELDKGRKMLEKSKAVLLVDFSKIKTADLRILRQELKKNESPMLVIKKRLLGVLFKEKNLELPMGGMKAPLGTVFASDLESAAGFVYRFFKRLETEKKLESGQAKILGGYNLDASEFIPAGRLITIGSLPAREVLLAQLLGMLAAPIRSFLYVLDQKAKQAQ